MIKLGALDFLHRPGNGAAIRAFAGKFDLVYFGHVDHRYDEHAVVRGVTASATHTDKHFAVGNVHGRDLSILERSNLIKFPGKGENGYHWVIVQVDLAAGTDLPHVFMDAHHHDEVFYSNLFINFSNFQIAGSVFNKHDPKFLEHFIVYAPSDRFDDVADVLTPSVTSMLAHHFNGFDYELDGSTLYIYNNQPTVHDKDLEEMVRVGLWLAGKLDAVHGITTLEEPGPAQHHATRIDG